MCTDCTCVSRRFEVSVGCQCVKHVCEGLIVGWVMWLAAGWVMWLAVGRWNAIGGSLELT